MPAPPPSMATNRRGGRLAQPLDMPQQLVDPDRDLVAEGRGHRVLAVGAAGHRHLGACARRDRPWPSAPRRSRRRKIACAWRSTSRSPVWVMFCVVAPQCTQPPCGSPTTRAKLPDQRHERVAGACKAFVDARAVQQLEPCHGGDGIGRLGWNDRRARPAARASATSTSSHACQRLSEPIEGANARDRRRAWRSEACRS